MVWRANKSERPIDEKQSNISGEKSKDVLSVLFKNNFPRRFSPVICYDVDEIL